MIDHSFTQPVRARNREATIDAGEGERDRDVRVALTTSRARRHSSLMLLSYWLRPGCSGTKNVACRARMKSVTIWHNPKCSKSRRALELIRERGIEPTIVKYLDTPPTLEQLEAALAALRFEPRDLMRQNERAYRDRSLGDASLSREELLRAMIEIPALIERPVVFRGERAVVGRPPETVAKLFED